MAGALARPPNKGKKPARDVKGKGKIGPAVRGRGVQARQVRRQTYEEELKELEQRLEELNPAASTSKCAITKFSELPITQATLAGLDSAYFHNTTSIQGRSLPYSLKGHDILASARTGSGKTLAFIIPVLERLYRAKWGPNDGLGALVISPTRELAVQIFDVLRKIGHSHSFSAGLVIGGKSLRDEQERLSRMNILIATPGRLLQHMDQTLSFDVSNLQILVLDEADRILDLGFSKTIDAIVSNLPPSGRGLEGGRQTLLFSATQTDSIQALARLSLSDPVYISVRNQDNDTNAITNTEGEGNASTNANPNQVAESSTANGKNGFNQYETPANLEQFYMIVDLDRKIDVLWTFIKSHLGCKTLVFLSSCKQVRFIYEAFRHLRPGISLLHLHGKQKQSKRLEIYAKFTASSHAVLFATDIASRGLDFPSVNWVVQMDCPEDVQSYVHRVGRTARYNSKGKALLMLLPSEKAGFEKRLRDKKLLANEGEEDDANSKGKLKPIKMNAQKKDQSIAKQIQSLLFKFNELKTLSQKSFVSYLRSIYMQKDKSTFRINDIANDKASLERYAKSIGLAGSPRIKFKGQQKEKEMKEKKNRPRAVEMLEAEAAKMPEHGTKKTFGGADNDDTADGGAAARLSKNNGDDEYPETSDEEASDPEEAEDSDNDDDDGAELDDATSEDSDHEASTTQKNGQPVFPSKKKNSKASTKLVGNDDEAEDDGDFLTLAPKQRHLELDIGDVPAASSDSGSKDILPLDHDDISKRKLKQGVTKKGLMALRGSGEKLVFDDEGTAHALYELVDDKTLTREEIEEERRRFVAEQGGKMKDVDVLDKEAIKALRREKKTARKAREREVDGRQKANNQNDEDDGPMLEDDEGEIVPDFDDIDLPSESEDDVQQKQSGKRKMEAQEDGEDDLEAMALQALRKKGRRA